MSRIRTFLAVEVPAGLRQKAADVIRFLGRHQEGIKWVDPQNIHVTVKFLGDVEDAEIYEVCQVTAKAIADLQPFRVACHGVGAFPNAQRPRTVWLGIDDSARQFEQLHRRVDDALAGLRFPREVRRYQPHLTLGRVRHGKRPPTELTARIHEQSAVDLGEIDVEELVVFSSELTPDGPVYTALSHAPLGG
jgi:2'-5' RNA ligase